MKGCDHKFVDSIHCLKCGWIPCRSGHGEERQLEPQIGDTCVNIDSICVNCGTRLATESLTRTEWERRHAKQTVQPLLFAK